MEFILLIGYTIGVYYIGMRRGIRIVLEQEELESEMNEEYIEEFVPEQTEKKDTKIMINIEYDENEGYFFVHEQNTQRFMAHGKTWQEVEERLKERFPGQLFGIDEDHAREIGML